MSDFEKLLQMIHDMKPEVDIIRELNTIIRVERDEAYDAGYDDGKDEC